MAPQPYSVNQAIARLNAMVREVWGKGDLAYLGIRKKRKRPPPTRRRAGNSNSVIDYRQRRYTCKELACNTYVTFWSHEYGVLISYSFERVTNIFLLSVEM